jgi:transposase
MEAAKVYAGVDVAKDGLKLALRPSGEHRSYANDRRGIAALRERLAELGCERIVLEASGGYETLVASSLWQAGLPVLVVNPRWVRDYGRSIGQLAKTDRLDARLLAQYAEHAELELRELPDEQTRALKELCARREDLLEMLGAERNRLEHASKPLRRGIERHVDYLEKQLAQIDHDLDQAIKNSPIWSDKRALLRSVPGVGPVLCSALLARLPELGRLNRGEVASLVGVAPVNHDSGKLRGTRMIAGGRAALRRALYMSAFAAIRHNPRLRAYYEQLRARGKPFKVALVAAMRKLIIILNAMLKTNSPWRPPCPA